MNHETSLFQPQPFAATIRRHSPRKQPRNRRRWTVFDRTSKRSFSVVRPPNRTSEHILPPQVLELSGPWERGLRIKLTRCFLSPARITGQDVSPMVSRGNG
ncbi:hypothetical protein GBA52_003371 [Prunus armeniaca]|nr:hypothetical protein GBA52_003371 [Prunus armeniaca]